MSANDLTLKLYCTKVDALRRVGRMTPTNTLLVDSALASHPELSHSTSSKDCHRTSTAATAHDTLQYSDKMADGQQDDANWGHFENIKKNQESSWAPAWLLFSLICIPKQSSIILGESTVQQWLSVPVRGWQRLRLITPDANLGTYCISFDHEAGGIPKKCENLAPWAVRLWVCSIQEWLIGESV